jgi:hypothetical protein
MRKLDRLIGQENEILRILFQNGYLEEEIDMVRDAFKTERNVFIKEIFLN